MQMWEQEWEWQEEWKPAAVTSAHEAAGEIAWDERPPVWEDKTPQTPPKPDIRPNEKPAAGPRTPCEALQEPDALAEEGAGEQGARECAPHPSMRQAAASFPPPRVNTGEEHVLFVQIVLCALMLAFAWFARSADAPFLPQMKTAFSEMLSSGVEFSTDNTFARFADSIVEQLRSGTRRLLQRLEEPEAMESGMGGVWRAMRQDVAPDGASLEAYTLPIALQYPVSGYLTSPYGFRDNPVNGEDDFHAGIDIGAAEGTPVVAAQAGIVMRTGYTRLRGYYVILRHDGGVQTLYQHLSYIFVRGGERVAQGQLIADVGSTGFVTGPHLHLELILDGVRVDPLPTFPRYNVT